MIWASTLQVESHGFDPCTSTFPDFYCQDLCCTQVDSCCLSLIVILRFGKLCQEDPDKEQL